MQWFVINLKKLILDHFLLKNSGTRFFPKKIIWVNLKHLWCCNFMQKIRKVSRIEFQRKLKSLVCGPLGATFDLKTSEQIFHNFFFSILSLNTAVTSCKKLETFYALTFNNTWKTDFELISGPFWPKDTKIKFFPIVTLCKISKKSWLTCFHKTW